MPSIYLSFGFADTDTREERVTKLYLGILSVGDDIYSKGAQLAELNKQITALERTVAEMREELKRLRTG